MRNNLKKSHNLYSYIGMLAISLSCFSLTACSYLSSEKLSFISDNTTNKEADNNIDLITTQEELIEKLVYTMQHNNTTCTLYTPVSNLFNAEELINSLPGLTQIECVQKSSGIITELNITLSFWDNYPVSYAFKNNDTSLLNERQLTLYDSYINTLAQITSPDNTQWQNELAIHDYLVSHITYTDGIPGNSYAYNAMIDGTAVCSGYAESFKTFMDFLGIENITVSGTARGEKHIWNMVCLDGEWYHTDVTWDDPVNGREDYIEHAYFNITDNDISLDHSWEYSSTPAASADIYSYKSIAGLANIADISTLNSIVTSAVNRREPFVEFTSSIPLDVTDAFTNINTNLTYYYKNTVRNSYTLYSIIFSY